MTRVVGSTAFVPAARALSLLGLSALLAPAAQAVTFNFGGLEAQLDSELSLRSGWALQAPQASRVGSANGGRGWAAIGDDGRLNFKRGETFSKRLLGEHALELRQGDSGLFLRGRYWYDFELKDEGRPFKSVDDGGRRAAAKSASGELLDAYLYHNYQLGDLPGNLRLGRQVIGWGQSRFLEGGIAAFNPPDAEIWREVGTQERAPRTPQSAFYLSQSLTDQLSAEFFYQLQWQPANLDNCGTFFARSDVLAEGCDGNLQLLDPALGDRTEGVSVPRGHDRKARDGGQFGVALRGFSAALDSEFSAYFINYHSRQPVLSAQAAPASAYPGALDPRGAAGVLGAGRYFVDYPEDIQLYGLAFSSNLVSGGRWYGEFSYRPNAPVQLNTLDVLYAPLGPDYSPLAVSPGEAVQGYRRKEVSRLQTGFVQPLAPMLGARTLSLAGEVGWTHVGGLESKDQARYGRDALFGPGALSADACALLAPSARQRSCGGSGFTSRDAWGYRARLAWEYPNLIGRVTLRPSLAWAHDVQGYSPGPDGNFEEGRKTLRLGLQADYLDSYRANIGYSRFFGGRYSTWRDRDYLALSVGLRF